MIQNLVGSGVFIIAILAITFMQRRVVEQTKKSRPEKRGDANRKPENKIRSASVWRFTPKEEA